MVDETFVKAICAIYYPIPLHSQKAYLDSRYKKRLSSNKSVGKRSDFASNAY
jgi:hypothetical protein